MVVFPTQRSRELILFLWNLSMALSFIWDQLGFLPFPHFSGFFFLGFYFVILLNLKVISGSYSCMWGFCPEYQDALASLDRRFQSSPPPLAAIIQTGLLSFQINIYIIFNIPLAAFILRLGYPPFKLISIYLIYSINRTSVFIRVINWSRCTIAFFSFFQHKPS